MPQAWFPFGAASLSYGNWLDLPLQSLTSQWLFYCLVTKQRNTNFATDIQ